MRRQGPVVALGYAHGGAAFLQRLLSGYETLACTAGTGVLPLCDVAATAWRQVEKRDGPLSPLALASIRAMLSGLITTALAGTGKLRWCETASAHPRCAEIFLQAYPAARFICLHRSCLEVIYAGVKANPWGLAGSPFESFIVAYPGNAMAAIAAYWAASTEPLLEFEKAHPDACVRVRYEDLTGRPDQVRAEIAAFLSIEPGDPVAPHQMSDDPPPASAPEVPIPVDRIPPPLGNVVNQLMERLGYPRFPSPVSS